MLPQSNRIRNNDEISSILRHGQIVSQGCIRIIFTKNNLPFTRLAFVVGKKRIAKATMRNAIKRHMREAVRQNLKDIRPSRDVICLFSGNANQVSGTHIRQSVVEALKKTHLI